MTYIQLLIEEDLDTGGVGLVVEETFGVGLGLLQAVGVAVEVEVAVEIDVQVGAVGAGGLGFNNDRHTTKSLAVLQPSNDPTRKKYLLEGKFQKVSWEQNTRFNARH